MGYLGRPIQKDGTYKKLDQFAFDGSVLTFDITADGGARSIIPGSSPNLMIVVNDIQLEPETDYTVSNNQVIFTTAYAGATPHHARVLGDSYKAPNTVPVDLNSLGDVAISAPAVDHVLKYNGSQWVNDPNVGTTHIANLGGVSISSPLSGHVLTYNGTDWTNIPNNYDITTHSVGELSDFTNSASSGEVLTWNGSAWVGIAYNLTELADTSVTGMSTGEVLTWNGSAWTNSAPQSSVNDINDLGDVDTTTTAPETNDVLSWNGSLWVPVDMTSGGGSPHTLDSHTDVSSGASLGQVLVWGGSSWNPANQSGGGGGGTLTGDVDIVVDSTNGDDANELGGSSVLTIARAIELANSVVTTDGIIRITLTDNTTHYNISEIVINHPNTIQIKSRDSIMCDINPYIDNTDDIGFIVHSNLELMAIRTIERSTIFQTKRYSNILIYNCYLTGSKLCVDNGSSIYRMNNMKSITVNHFSTFDFSETSIIRCSVLDWEFSITAITNMFEIFNIEDCDIPLFKANITGIYNAEFPNNPMFYYNRCTIKKYSVHFVNCNIPERNVTINHRNGVLTFNSCIIHRLEFEMEQLHQSPILFISTKVHDMYYQIWKNVSAIHEPKPHYLDGQYPLIKAYRGSDIRGSMSCFDEPTNEINSLCLYAYDNSRIMIDSMTNIIDGGSIDKTDPDMTSDDDNLVLRNIGSYITMGYVYLETAPSSSSSSGESGSGESGSGEG